MDYCFKNNLLNEIIKFLAPIDIISLSMCNKSIYEQLKPENNNIINTIFLFSILDTYFNIESINYFKNKKNLLGKNVKFTKNWKLFLKQFKHHFGIYEDKNISSRVLDFFKIHIYLPDLRKECFHLEFEKNSIHELINYDINQRLIHTYHFYSKTINFENIVLNPEKKGKIKILRENLTFEESLINIDKLFPDFVNNKKYIDFVNDDLILYKYENLYNIYIKTNFHTFEKCNNKDINYIFNFILWINHIFMFYCEFNYEYINGLFNNIDDEELLSEYIAKKNDLINCALLINSAYENANIIINFLHIFKNMFDEYNKNNNSNGQLSLSLCSSGASDSDITQNGSIDEKKWKDIIISPNKFTLYNLFIKIIENNYSNKLTKINPIFQTVSNNYFQEAFDLSSIDIKNETKNKNKMEDEDDDSMINEIKSEDEEDLSMDIDDADPKPTKKELVESMCNSQVDRFINGNNANGIMHSGFKADDNYINNYENILINLLEEQILKSLNVDKMPIDQCFDIVDKITKCEGNSKGMYFNRDSLIVIRRTKKRLMKKGFGTVFSYLLELLSKDFSQRLEKDPKNLYLNVIEKTHIQDYTCNMDALTEDGEKNVEKYVEEDYKKAEEYLTKKFNLDEDGKKIAKDYIKCVKIHYVLLFKKILFNYYKQLEIYKERNVKVEYYLSHKNLENCYQDETKENKLNKRSDDLFNGCNFIKNEEVPIDSKFI